MSKPYLDAPDKEKRNMHRNRLSTRRWYWTSSRRKSALTAKEAPLTKKNLKSYCCFCRIKDGVFSREDILNRIWSDEVYVLDRTIDVNITRLRKKSEFMANVS